MILLYHVDGEFRNGSRPCGGPALGLKHWHRLDAADFPAENVLKLDGTSPQRGEYVICGTCRQPIHVSWLSYKQSGKSN